jgi:hypothetical protein
MPVPKLTLVPYLQRWDSGARTLSIRVLVAPTGNPLEPLLTTPSGVPAFADASLAFRVNISDTVDALPQRTLVDQVIDSNPQSWPDSRNIFEALKGEMGIPDGPGGDTFSPQSRDLTSRLRKYLPLSYRHAYNFVQPRTSLAVVDDTYHCLVQCPPEPAPPPPPSTIGWGEALAFSLRRPRLAEALGLISSLDLELDPAPRLENGGWLWVELAPTSDYAAQVSIADFLRVFATRVPELAVSEARPVFTPVVFPVSDDAADAAALGNFDKVFTESIRFDDGFSKIVHARQPVSMDPLDEDGTAPTGARDEGVYLGWDDEDILEGQNRSLGAAPDGEDNVVAPRGVLGYRIDVRTLDSASPQPWSSLCKVDAPLMMGIDLGSEVEERWCEVHPTEIGDQLWLSPWFVAWRGGSLVMATVEEQRLMNVPPGAPESDTPVGADDVDLRYGERYEFRVRLADATGGGPDETESPVRDGEAPTGTLHMKRHLRPRRCPVDPPTLAADGSAAIIRVRRPTLGYPEAVFAAGPSARNSLLNQIAANDADPATATPPFIRDPATPYLRIRVHLRLPTFDPDADEGGWVQWYETSRAFPTDVEQALELTLDWQEAADYHNIDISGQLGADGTVSGDLTVIKSRDVRLELFAVGANDLSYFATASTRIGEPDTVDLHTVAAAETEPLRDLPVAEALRSVFMRADPVGDRAEVHAVAAQNDPTPALVDRLAIAADLASSGSMLLGREGERVAFGCAGLAHHLAPDGTSLEFAEPGELADQWINVVQCVIDRDWTWRGGGSPTVAVSRIVSLRGGSAAAERTAVGTVELMHTVNVQASRKPDRSHVRVVFLDALAPPLGSDGLPYEVDVSYTMRVSFEGGTSVAQSIDTRLPVVIAPAQVPRVAAAGIALSPYQPDDRYASTISRTRRLWLEFAEPIADPRDAYFVRPLFRTPDPMLLPETTPVADPDVVESIPMDPEWVRIITPGQVKDLAGISAMQRLEPADDSSRRFLVPLPPNTDPASPELFSFFTYEIRVGHDAGPPNDPFWTTAQGRFGEPLVLEGMQHPSPELSCSVFVGTHGQITAQAPLATPYLGLKRVLPILANTEMWMVLYARVRQADGQGWRNIEIDLRRAEQVFEEGTAPRAPRASFTWAPRDVRAALEAVGLPEASPLTVLAVELLPEPNGTFADPLGRDLGEVRILRSSPLASVERDCCAS